jgi:hypothetical protein
MILVGTQCPLDRLCGVARTLLCRLDDRTHHPHRSALGHAGIIAPAECLPETSADQGETPNPTLRHPGARPQRYPASIPRRTPIGPVRIGSAVAA